MAYASTQDARDFYAGEEAPALDVEVAMGAADRTVVSLAPAPDPVTDDYPIAARHAELLIGRYVWSTQGGMISSKGIADLSKSFASLDQVKQLAAGAMGSYYRDPAKRKGRMRSVPLERG